MSPGPLHSPGSSSDSNGGDAEGPGPPAPVSNLLRHLSWSLWGITASQSPVLPCLGPRPSDTWALALATPMLPSALLSPR